MAVKRYETVTLDRGRAVRLDNGMLKVPARLTRVGVFLYLGANGKIERALRPPEEVFNADSVASFDLVPLTNDHPSVEDGQLVTAETYTKLNVGTVSNPQPNGKFLEATLRVNDSKAIDAVLQGKQEISCGYLCDRDYTPGVWEGQPYDYVQRNIRGNHVAIVDHGRAGPDVRIQLDSEAAVMVEEDSTQAAILAKETKPMLKVTIDGVDFDVSTQVQQALQKERGLQAAMLDSAKAEATKAKGEIERLTATLDGANAKIKQLEEELKTAPAKIKAELAERVALEAKAKSVLGAEFKCDSLDVQGIKRAVAEKLTDVKCADKSAAYVDALFDVAVKDFEKKNAATEAVEAQKQTAPKAEEKATTDSKEQEDPEKAYFADFFNPKK